MSDSKTVTVSILDKSYQVNCAPDEVKALRESAQYLDEKMREVKTNSNVLGLDRLAVMVALNITNDLLLQSDNTAELEKSHLDQLKTLDGKLDQAIARFRTL